MFKHKSLIKTAAPQPGILKRKRLSAPPIPIIIFFFHFSFPALAGCLSAVFFLFSCQRSTEPLEKALPEQEFTLTVESAEVTEVWLKLQAQPLDERISYLVQRGDTHTVFSGKLYNNDTLLHDFNLQPARDYEYKAYRLVDGHKLPPPVALTTTTMDTTSHDFQWKVFTFGTGGSSYLNDVAIIGPNDIWCVGKINASGGPYNAAHWDGNLWELKHVYVDYRGKPNLAPLKGVFALDNGEVVFSSGLPFLPTNNGWKLYHLWDMGILDENDGGVDNIWGTSLSNLYFAGRNGTIAHYDGQSWQRIESPVDVNINDIYGYEIQSTGESIILCAAGDVYKKDQAYIIKINDDYSTELFTWNISDPISSLWIANSFRFYACGNGIWIKQFKDWNWTNPGSTFSRRVRGTGINDIFVTGDYAHILHFNGKSWQDYQFLYSGIFEGLDVSHDVVVACGSDGRKAYIIMAER